MSDTAKTLLIRYHDGAARTNWGGRATSLALADIINRLPGRRLGDVINGVWLTQDFDAPAPSEAVRVLRRLKGAERTEKLMALAKKGAFATENPAFETSPAERAAALLEKRGSSPALDAIVAQIEACDEMAVNGEGDFILGRRRSLWRCLILMEIARLLGKPVHLINAMLSRGPNGETDETVVTAVGATVRAVATVALRDRESVRLCGELYPDVKAQLCPDALFSWADPVRRLIDQAAVGPVMEGAPTGLREALDRPYVAVSGGSLKRAGEREASDARVMRMLEALSAAGLNPVIVATCTGDDWVMRVAQKAGFPTLPSDVPLAIGAYVLGRADAFLTGRYHPGILASLSGTPCVFMRSNSHKTRSLPELLGSAQTIDFPFFTEEQDVDAIAAATVAAAQSNERPRLLEAVDGLARQARALPLPAIG